VLIGGSSSNSTVGDTALGAANVIAFNKGDGVRVVSDHIGNRILSNSIFQNGELGIDLVGGDETTIGFGVTANDDKDPDTGANNLQNRPVLLYAADKPDGTTVIPGGLSSRPRKTYTIQFFSSFLNDASGYGEGQTFLGQIKVKTNKTGNATFAFTTTLPAGEPYVTATATGGDGTSEFSDWENAP
jgi:hypothetical protein